MSCGHALRAFGSDALLGMSLLWDKKTARSVNLAPGDLALDISAINADLGSGAR